MTTPGAAAFTGVPTGAAMSIPPCGLRGCPLKKRRKPNELERTPGTGWRNCSEAGTGSVQVAMMRALCLRSRRWRDSTSLLSVTCPGATFRCCSAY